MLSLSLYLRIITNQHMKKEYLLLLASTAFLGVACKQQPSSENKRTVFLDLSGRDTTVKPGDDFFQYANGTWMKNTKIPDDQSGWGSFYTLYEDNQKNLRSILDEISKKENAKGSLEQK